MDPATAAGLTARDVHLRRDGRVVLAGAAVTVVPGSITALVAPSGAGKSTLLRCLNGLTAPDSGTIRLAGRDVATIDPRELRRRVGLVLQAPAMLPGSVHENVAYALPGTTAVAVAAALEAAGLDPGFAGREAGGLSGGERARVALARAFARGPEVLLLDEPTAALDGRTAALIGATLRRLAGEGIGICLAVHDVVFARGLADRVVGLDGHAPPELQAGPDGHPPPRPAGVAAPSGAATPAYDDRDRPADGDRPGGPR